MRTWKLENDACRNVGFSDFVEAWNHPHSCASQWSVVCFSFNHLTQLPHPISPEWNWSSRITNLSEKSTNQPHINPMKNPDSCWWFTTFCSYDFGHHKKARFFFRRRRHVRRFGVPTCPTCLFQRWRAVPWLFRKRDRGCLGNMEHLFCMIFSSFNSHLQI